MPEILPSPWKSQHPPERLAVVALITGLALGDLTDRISQDLLGDFRQFSSLL
jgi:hypothetical protein